MSNQKRPRFRKQITSVTVYICPECNVDLVPRNYAENVSGEIIIKTKHVCISEKSCKFEFYE